MSIPYALGGIIAGAQAVWMHAHRAAYPSPQKPVGDENAKEAIEASLLLVNSDPGMKELLSGDRASQQNKIAVQKCEALHAAAVGASAPQNVNDGVTVFGSMHKAVGLK